ncbi:MAG: CHAT domain-containing protein [Anaerolineae bacterium]
MERLEYLDFEIRLEKREQRYVVSVIRSPAGEAEGEFVLPFPDLELENLLLKIGRTRRGVRRIGSPEEQAARAFGGKLFEAVFKGDVRGCFRSSLDKAALEAKGLRIKLRLLDTPELADLPWEYLYNRPLNRFLSLSAHTPIVRYIKLPEPIRPLDVKPPLRILVMVSSPSDYVELDVGQEKANLLSALGNLEQRGMVEIEWLEEATLLALQRCLRRGRYHIFHFIGHGGFDERAQDGLLLMEDERGRGWRVSGQHLGVMLNDHRTLRLAVLNACEGARSSRTDPFAGVAMTLVQQGIPAVVAMQFEITDQPAQASGCQTSAASQAQANHPAQVKKEAVRWTLLRSKTSTRS